MTTQIRMRCRASAIILLEDHVLLHRGHNDDWWALPGGGVEPGETAQQALLREVDEELGEAVSVGRLVFVVENFFTLHDEAYHQLDFQFVAALPPTSRLRDTTQTHQGREAYWHAHSVPLLFQWVPVAALAALPLPLKPTFLAHRLQSLPDAVQHIVWDERR